MQVGGSEFKGETIGEYTRKDKQEEIQYNLPFGGGAGAGVNINPVAFLVISGSGVKLLPVEYDSTIDKLLDYIPDLVDKANNLMNKMMQDKKEEKNKIRQEEINKRREQEKYAIDYKKWRTRKQEKNQDRWYKDEESEENKQDRWYENEEDKKQEQDRWYKVKDQQQEIENWYKNVQDRKQEIEKAEQIEKILQKTRPQKTEESKNIIYEYEEPEKEEIIQYNEDEDE